MQAIDSLTLPYSTRMIGVCTKTHVQSERGLKESMWVLLSLSHHRLHTATAPVSVHCSKAWRLSTSIDFIERDRVYSVGSPSLEVKAKGSLRSGFSACGT